MLLKLIFEMFDRFNFPKANFFDFSLIKGVNGNLLSSSIIVLLAFSFYLFL
jgi:hypothetical protein